MKLKIFSSLLIIGALFLSTACTEDLEYKDVDVTAVKQLYSPKDKANVKLLASATASVFFEWSSALAKDGNSPLYEVVFDKTGGDFSNPIYRLTSDNMGTSNYATISHKTLDKIGQLAGLESGETGDLSWTIVSSRGIRQMAGQEVRTLHLTRLLGFSEIPVQLYVTGEGAETGTDDTKAYAFSSPAIGEFEIFTKLEAGKAYHFIDNRTGTKRIFYTDGTALKESSAENGSSTVAETGIYRINLDFNIASVTIQKVVSLGWFFCPDNKVDIPLNYQGNGIWEGSGATPFHQESWGRDQRYKFQMVLADANGNEKTIQWGPTNASLDSAPSDNQAPDYFYMKEWTPSQWDNKWKLHSNYDTEKNGGKNTKFTFILNASGPYTHTVAYAD